MPYIHGRIVHDADAHIMETPELFEAYVEPAFRARAQALNVFRAVPGYDGRLAKLRAAHADAAYRAQDEAQIMLRKNWDATGSFLAADRARALDLIGVSSQLVFNTMLSGFLVNAEHAAGGRDDLDFALALARAHNRAMAEFCSVDRRLLPALYVPLADRVRAPAMAKEAIAQGAKALLIPSQCPKGHAPSHIDFDAVWAQAQDAGIPIVFHVGGGGPLLSPDYFNNGLPPVPDFHGGAENFRSVDYMAIPYPPMQTLATLIFDGVLERFPDLKFGVIEQGALWLPGWMRSMDSAHAAFFKNEARLQNLKLKPSDYVRRQVRATPYPHEDVAWIAANAGAEVALFSTDYPHVEGGRNPVKRFESSMEGMSEEAVRRFYCDNFIDLMGAGLAEDLRYPQVKAA